MTHETLAGLFHDQARQMGPRTLFLHKRSGTWESTSWSRAGATARAWARGLVALGLERGQRVAILSENRPEWAFADQAVLACGAADVPLYTTQGHADIVYILRDAACRFLFVSGAHLEKIITAWPQTPALEQVFTLDPPGSPRPGVLPVSELAKLGGEVEDQSVSARLAGGRRTDLATIIYTSGTTGPPKGVMLTHGNLLANCEAIHRHIDIQREDRNLSFLPLSHSFERTAGYYVFLMAGGEIAYAQNTTTIAEDMIEVKPTILLGVPRFYEKFHSRVTHAVSRSRVLRRSLFTWGTSIGRRVFERRNRSEPIPGHLGLRYAAARSFVFRKILERTGGRIRFFVSGGAPLSPEIVEFFGSVGLTLLEGYGLTETSPVIACNQPHCRRLGSVGKPLPGLEVKTADDGEILVRGPSVMLGYLNRPEETAETIDAERFLHTGDVGKIDEEGFLFIHDRKKDIIITSGGKNIAPQNVENRLQLQDSILQACLIGERRPFVTALIVPDFAVVASRLGITADPSHNEGEIIERPETRELLLEAVLAANASLASYERVKRFAILAQAFSQENGELTPTLKLRRHEIERRHAPVIDGLYDQDERADRETASPGRHCVMVEPPAGSK